MGANWVRIDGDAHRYGGVPRVGADATRRQKLGTDRGAAECAGGAWRWFENFEDALNRRR